MVRKGFLRVTKDSHIVTIVRKNKSAISKIKKIMDNLGNDPNTHQGNVLTIFD